MDDVAVHDSWGVPNLKVHEGCGELHIHARLCALARAPSVQMISPTLPVSKELIAYQLLEHPSHLHLRKDMSEGAPQGILGQT